MTSMTIVSTNDIISILIFMIHIIQIQKEFKIECLICIKGIIDNPTV